MTQESHSFFAPARAAQLGLLPEDMPFAHARHAALVRKPRVGVVWLSALVGAFVISMILWSAFASVDEVTHAEGQVIAAQRTQVIQNLEGGIVRAIMVEEGQTVEKGDVLAQLDNEIAASAYRDVLNKTLDHALSLIRLKAEAQGIMPQWPTDLAAYLQGIMGTALSEDLMAQALVAQENQNALFTARTQQRAAELELLDAQWSQRQHDVAELTQRLKNVEDTLKIAIEQRNIAASLFQRGSYSRAEQLNTEKHALAMQTEVDSLRVNVPRARAAEQEAAQRGIYRKAEIAAALADEINKRQIEFTSAKESLSAGGDRVTRTELRTPVRGTVKRISITTLGGVVKPGESIMEIVPLDDTLLVEARVRPQDVAFLRSGQQAVVKISAYDFSIYGGLDGALEQISADTIEDKRGEMYYMVKVRTHGTEIQYQNTTLPIIPGMMATVDILTGKKTVLDYLLKPILKARQNALRER